MKRATIFTTFLALFLITLSACGQGVQTIESDQSSTGVETEENTDFTEPETENHSNNEATNSETVTKSEEQNEDPSLDVVEEVTGIPVELFFADADVMNIYRVERTIDSSDEELFKATLQKWIEGPTEENLVSLLPNTIIVQSVEEVDGIAHVSFSADFLDAQVGSGPEEMLLQQIAMTMKQFGFNETQILVDGESHPELFGHIDISVPIVANNPEDYEKVE